jgi:hypothetical protein
VDGVTPLQALAEWYDAHIDGEGGERRSPTAAPLAATKRTNNIGSATASSRNTTSKTLWVQGDSYPCKRCCNAPATASKHALFMR